MEAGLDRGWALAGALLSALLVIFALAFIVNEFISFRRRKTPGYTGFISIRSTRRRITGSLILIALAIMLYSGLCAMDLSQRPMLFGLYWIVCALLAFVLFLLGLLDFREVREHHNVHELKLLWRVTRGMPKKDKG